MSESVQPERQVVLTLIGRVNVGKSTLSNALLRRELASVDPRAGWTREVTLYPVSEELALADTPGLDDPNPAVAGRAFDFVGHSDLFVHLHNLDEGVSHSARDALARLRESGLPVAVVFNKADLVPAPERAQRVRSETEKLAAAGLPVFPTSASTGEGLQALSDWIDDTVATQGSDLVWARVCRHARPVLEQRLAAQVDQSILRHALIAGGFGLVPIPIVDIPAILGVQFRLARALGRIYAIEMNPRRLREVVGVIAGGFTVRQIGRQLAKLVPWVGWVLSGAVAFGATYGMGKALAHFYRTGLRLDPERLRSIYREELEAAQARFRSDPELRRRAEEAKGREPAAGDGTH